MRIPSLLWISLLVAPVSAYAAEDGQVDLSLPSTPMFTGPAAFGDGEYTGPRTDTAGYREARDPRLVRRGGCPTGPDGSERTVTGSVSTGIGYASRGGTSHWNAADINLCRETVSNSRNVNTMHLNMRVSQSDGPGYFGGPYGGYYGGAGGYFDSFGPRYRDIHSPWGMGGMPRNESWTEGRQPWR